MAIRKKFSTRAKKIKNVLIFISHHHPSDMASSSSFLPSAGDKLKKLQLNKKESSLFLHKETSTSKLLANISSNGSPSSTDASSINSDFEEIMVTIRKSERGFGFELKNGILIVRVHPNSPAFYSGIQVGDIIIKINGTCVRGKETAEITNMIHESNSFVSLTLQRKLSTLTNPSSSKYGESIDDDSGKMNISNSNTSSLNVIGSSVAANTMDSSSDQLHTLKNVTNQMGPPAPPRDLSFSRSEHEAKYGAVDSDNDGEEDEDDEVRRLDRQQQDDFIDYENTENQAASGEPAAGVDASLPPTCTPVAKGQHRKQHSMSEESFQQLSRNASESSAGRRRTIKKTRSTTTPKTYQTQSLSNITSTLTHSTSDNEIDHNKQQKQQSMADNDQEFILNSKDDLSYTSEDNLHDGVTDKTAILRLLGSLWSSTQMSIKLRKEQETARKQPQQPSTSNSFDLNGFGDYGQLMAKPLNTAFLLNFLLSETSESPKNLYFCLFVDELITSTEKKETLARWCQELYSTFLMNNAPLKIKTNDAWVRKIEDYLDKNPIENLTSIKRFFDDIRHDAIEQVNVQLGKFREVHQMDGRRVRTAEVSCYANYYLKHLKGPRKPCAVKRSISLANLFHGGSDLIKHYQSVKSESEHFRSYIADSFQRYTNDIAGELGRVSQDWNDIRSSESQISALISCFATYVKRFSLPIKYIGKFELDKIPTFLNKKSKSNKKNPVIPARGHNFIESFINVKSTCLKCGLPFWGINNQGYICQKSKCELKIHRHCLNSGVNLECHGSLKSTIRTDYKEKFDNFQKILFGVSKKKEEEQAMDTSNGSINRSTFYPTHSSSSNLSVASGSLDSQGVSADPSAPPIANFDQRNLPVELAIRKFESLNKRPNIPLITSPTNGNGSGLIRANTMNSSSVSPTSSDPRLNHSGLSQVNSLLASMDQPTSSRKSTSHFANQHQILPNKHCPSTTTITTTANQHPSNHSNQTAEALDALASKEQACKRVSSFKVDVKKVKANVARSKSDPEPEEIKKSISTATAVQNSTASSSNQYRFNDRFSIDSTAPDQNEPAAFANNANSSSLSGRLAANASPATASQQPSTPASSLSHQQSFSSSLTPSYISMPSSSTLNAAAAAASRHSWMNDSDMEVDEELPNLSVNIEKQRLEQMTKKEIKMQEVINELIHTEQKHVRNLKIMKFHFYVPIKMEMFLSEDERNLLFPNLDEILELHSNFNENLKKLRKENTVVPIKKLIDVVLQQFEGEQGAKFETACATFCQNQGEAMKLLQSKMKQHAADKFSLFLNRAENDPICRKLHLKDFIPTEVQRLVKYRLLFQELTKNATDERDKVKLEQCMNASSRISQYVNKAVTECENQKRTVEVQSKMETKEFDQYCIKSPILAQYKNLDLTARKLIYEGELEWKLANNLKLMAFLFSDILVFLERVRHEAADEKRRYALRPLICTVGKLKRTFTPVIPLSCINSFRPMPDKRGFHMVVFIDDGTKPSKSAGLGSSSSSNKPIQTQILFILNAKSGEERNKWTSHLQALTGKMSDIQSANIDLTLNHQSSASSLISLASNAPNAAPTAAAGGFGAIPEAGMLAAPTSQSNQSSSNDLVGGAAQKSLYEAKAALESSRRSPIDKLESLGEAELRSQLIMNTQSIVDLLATRQLILAKLLKTSGHRVDFDLFAAETDVGAHSPSKQQQQQTSSDDLICHSLELMNELSHGLVAKTTTTAASDQNAALLKPLAKLEKTLNRLHSNLLQQKREDLLARLPTLQLPQSATNMMNEDSLSSCSNTDLPNGGGPGGLGSNRLNRHLHNRQSITSFTSSEFVSSSLMSTSNAAELSEDEQITYHYNDDDETMGIPVGSIHPLTYQPHQSPYGAGNSSSLGVSDSIRRLSNSSDRTLIVVPTNGNGANGSHLDLPRSPNSSSISNDSSSDKISASDSSNKLSCVDAGAKKKLKVANINELQEDELIRERVYDERGADVDADDEEDYQRADARGVYATGHSQGEDDDEEDEVDDDDDDDSVDRLTLGDDDDDVDEDEDEEVGGKSTAPSTNVLDNDYGAQALRNIIEYNGTSSGQTTAPSYSGNGGVGSTDLFDRKTSIPLLANPNSMLKPTMVDPLAPTTTLLTSPRGGGTGYSKIITSPATITSSIYATATPASQVKYDSQVPSFVVQKSPSKMTAAVTPSSSPAQQALLSTHNEMNSVGIIGNNNTGAATNDSSDDEVKDYFSFKENFDEVSHV